jgi:integrase
MANKKVALVRKVKTTQGWRRYPVVMSANGKVKPDVVLVGGTEVAYELGHYELRSYVGSKVQYERVDGNATEALAALKLAQKRANAVAMAGDAGVQILVHDSKRKILRDEQTRFVQAAVNRGCVEAAEIYKRTMDDFLAGCSKTYADEVSRDDVTKFHTRMKARGLSARTVHNRHMNLRAFLLSLGIDIKVIAGKAPRFDKTMPEIYEPEDLVMFFAAIDSPFDLLLFDMLLTTGLREREAMHLEWTDMSTSRRTLQVRSKPDYGHRIKNAEEREMTLTDDILAQLSLYRESHQGQRLVFGKRGGSVDAPDGHLLRRCKRLAYKAKLNCETCSTCVASDECQDWFLHKFRATYCTTLLRSGMDLRTVQRLMGHSDLASTMRYLRPAGSTEIQSRVNAIKWR